MHKIKMFACTAVLVLSFNACTFHIHKRRVDLRQIRAIETTSLLRWKQLGHSPIVEPQPLVVQGKHLQALLSSMRCHHSRVLWKGGLPATLVMADGSRIKVSGFSFYGKFLRISSNQWCVINDKAWEQLWLR